MLRFTLKDLFESVTLIAIGMGMLVLGYKLGSSNNSDSRAFQALLAGLYFGSGAAIGAGVLVPFKRGLIGAIIGIVMCLGLFAYRLF